VCVAAIGLKDVAALQLAQPSLGKMAVKEPAQPFWCHIPRLAGTPTPRRFSSFHSLRKEPLSQQTGTN